MSPFQILYGMHPRGVYELRNLGKQELRSVDGEDFAVSMQELQEKVKQKLQERNHQYKQREDMRRRPVDFEVGELVMAYHRMERTTTRAVKKEIEAVLDQKVTKKTRGKEYFHT
jgi:hypothetical protein